jgi:predicted metal-binding membrane protein
MGFREALLALARRPSPILLAVSLAGWVLLLVLERHAPFVPLCLSPASLVAAADGFPAMSFETASLSVVMLSWLLMIVAMMSPLLTQPLAQLRLRSLKRRRGRSVALFFAGYFAIWMTAGMLLLPLWAMLGSLAGNIGLPAWVFVTALAVVWQTTPLRQRALNRCHRLPRLSAFGAAADRDRFGFGLAHGFWCAATCFPMMVVPLAMPVGHLPLMFAVSVGLLLERMLPARQPAWTFHLLPGQTVLALLLRSRRWSAT